MQSAKIPTSAGSKAKFKDVEHKASKMRMKKKGQQQNPLTDDLAKTRTLMNRKRVKEHKKKKMKKKSETRRKQSLGEMLMKTNSRHIDSSSGT